mmetsp:Transcript_33537/g.75833  ORF Transcript_33537/g.75833 Transcript_33537/m.75833 type:complete len:206 (+) Transcript_33537:1092-1709(+)
MPYASGSLTMGSGEKPSPKSMTTSLCAGQSRRGGGSLVEPGIHTTRSADEISLWGTHVMLGCLRMPCSRSMKARTPPFSVLGMSVTRHCRPPGGLLSTGPARPAARHASTLAHPSDASPSDAGPPPFGMRLRSKVSASKVVWVTKPSLPSDGHSAPPAARGTSADRAGASAFASALAAAGFSVFSAEAGFSAAAAARAAARTVGP